MPAEDQRRSWHTLPRLVPCPSGLYSGVFLRYGLYQMSPELFVSALVRSRILQLEDYSLPYLRETFGRRG